MYQGIVVQPFSNPHQSMNPNKQPNFPDCFKNYKQFSEWLGLARLAKEQCTICEDCTLDYKLKMEAEQRCHEKWHSVQVVMQKKIAPIFAKSSKSNVMETQIDPLSW